MTTRRFDRLALSVIATAVIATGVATFLSPTNDVTAAPRVSFDQAHAEDGYLSDAVRRVAPEQTDVAALAGEIAAKNTRDALRLAESFEKMGYRLDHIRDGDVAVPRLYLASLPENLNAVPEVDLKKTLFFQTMLPLILQENEKIMNDRRRLLTLRAKTRLGYELPARDRLWLMVLAERYRLKDVDLDQLAVRVDVIPTSLAMAQAAEESGWGTSRFARQGNALFGQWTTSGDIGLVPEERPEGMSHKVKVFDNLAQSVSAYMRNLNTHGAYRKLRAMRAEARSAGSAPTGHGLAGALTKYSERGMDYVRGIRKMIDANELRGLDGARLTEEPDQSA